MVTPAFIGETLIVLAFVIIAFYAGKIIGRSAGKEEGIEIGKWIGEGENICKVGDFADLFRALNAKSLKFEVNNILPLLNPEGHQYSQIVVIILDKLVMWDGEEKFFPRPADSRRDTRYISTSADLKIGQTYSITQPNPSFFDEKLIKEDI